jgi:cell volume regulation protein A
MIAIEYILIIGASLIILSIAIAKLFDNLGVPTLILFIGVGILAGSEGPGGIYFDDAGFAQSIGIIALIFILFAGGLDTNWKSVKHTAWHAVSLSTAGVFLTSIFIAVFLTVFFDFRFILGLLIGSIISSTDAAAVFSILRSKNISLKGKVKSILELESGSNDPMAVFLTVGCIQLLTIPEKTVLDIALLFIFQMGLGSAFGFLFGKGLVILINQLKFSYEGIYPVFTLAFAILVFGFTTLLNGSGFLAVYILGLVVGNSSFVQKRSMIRFFDGLAWLSQIAMFLTLGLLVFPNQIIAVIGLGLLISLFLIFVARPLSVFLSLSLLKLNWREMTLISWVGLRGAVPIILATFPMLAGLPDAEMIFNVVFFIVITSALLQGWSLPLAAKWLKLDEPFKPKISYPMEFNPSEDSDTEVIDLIIPYNSQITGKTLAELDFPADSRIVMIWRNEKCIIPGGGTILETGDALLILVNKNNIERVKEIITPIHPS